MKVIAKRKIRYQIGLERTYAKEIVAHTKSLFTVIRSFIPRMANLVATSAVAFDDTEDELSRLMAEIAQAVESLPSMEPQVSKMYDTVRRHAVNEIVSVFMSVFGAVPRVIPEPLRQDDEFSDMLRNSEQLEQLKRLWVQENLDLIRSIDAETLRKIRETLTDMILGNVNRAELTRDLQRGISPVIFGKAFDELERRERNRAALIGRDQVGKLNGKLAEYQQRQLGITEYVWVTAGDERVRASHKALNGRTFQWDKPPREGHPGYPIQCRCIADPIIDIDKINLQPKAGTYAPLDDEGNLEQAKKYDRKIFITDIAIDKVPYVKLPEVSEAINTAIMEAHKELLRRAKDSNNSNEVLAILSFLNGNRKAFVPGSVDTVGVDISNPEAYHLLTSARAYEIFYLHNHPSGASFSFADLVTFTEYPQIGVMSVVTNLGKVFMLQKTAKYDYNKMREIIQSAYAKVKRGTYSERQAVREVLRKCEKGGARYVRSK